MYDVSYLHINVTSIRLIIILPFQQADVSCVVFMCGLIHQRYAEFCEPLKKTLVKMFENYNGKDEEKVSELPFDFAFYFSQACCICIQTILVLSGALLSSLDPPSYPPCPLMNQRRLKPRTMHLQFPRIWEVHFSKKSILCMHADYIKLELK